MRRVMWSKFALLVVALIAAYVAAQRPAGILFLVSASFSLAGAAFVPAMVMGIFWKGTSRLGAVWGMLVGLGVTIYYMALNSAAVRAWLGVERDSMAPTELIHAILQAPADLLYNGGIGTYIKASTQSQAEANDRANDRACSV